ncbi:MAG: hypothetical protein AAF449_24950, partial [Myxococcota bacterium]
KQETNLKHSPVGGESEPSNREIEERVFRKLEAEQKAWKADHASFNVVLEYPDSRTFFQRLAAFWQVRFD